MVSRREARGIKDSGRVAIVVALLLLFLLTVIETKAFVKRSTDLDNPCNINQVTNDIQITSTEPGLLQLFETIKNKAEESNQILLRINIGLNSSNADWVVDPETMLNNEETRQLFDSDIHVFVVKVNKELYNLTRYLNHIRIHGYISSLSSKEEIRENVRKLEKLINSTRCNLNTIGITNEYILSDDFVIADGNYLCELHRAFVVFRDLQKYMAFLTVMFKPTGLQKIYD